MTPVQFPGQTAVLGAPLDWNPAKHGPCEGLPVRYADGQYLSYWRPTWCEWWALLVGRRVRLWVVASGHPLVTIDVARGGR